MYLPLIFVLVSLH